MLKEINIAFNADDPEKVIKTKQNEIVIIDAPKKETPTGPK